MSQDEARFNEYLRRQARQLDPVPPVPREEMWARIDALRRPAPGEAGGSERVIPLAPRRRPLIQLVRWAPALAAMLVLGVAIGRLTVRRAPSGRAPLAATANATAANPAAAADSAEQLPYRVAANEHLERTEALLTSLPAEAQTGHAARVSGWAGDLLTDTRLLMDSPAGRDPELMRLLQDLEVVLAQIAALPGDVPAVEVQMIQDGIERRYVLLRLRAATAKRTTAAS